ncbi:MAG TPA: ferritin-like domain-containing protein [Candidatus Binatia bacterium]|nr:ferritin-like domain-containing protein [Candidatus Binatia bacterium]
MQYAQRNPLPLPPGGASGNVVSEINTVFDWEYALSREKLMALYEKGKAATWNASDIDWSINVDLDAFIRSRVDAGVHHMVNALLAPPIPLEPEQLIEMNLNTNAWMLSQFLHGEQGALLATAKIVLSAPMEEGKFYAANQVADEARHVEVYHRYLTEKLGRSFEVNRHLRILLDQILSDSRWDMTYLGMQILVEGLALAAFGLMKVQMPDEPLIQDITSRIMQDESRHVAFGVLSLEDIYRNQLTSAELREREDFVIEATYLMRDRLLMEQVYERMGWDVDLWVNWAKSTPYMTGFRRMLFSKIVPNLRRLGLLTPRVRDAYEKIGILEFADMKDSTEDPDVMPPEELVRLIQQFQAAAATPAAPA